MSFMLKKQENVKNNSKDIKGIINSLFKFHIDPILKSPDKLTSNFKTFLPALECYTYYSKTFD